MGATGPRTSRRSVLASLRRGAGLGSVSDGRLAVIVFIAVAVAYWIALPHVDIQGRHPISDGSIYGAMAEHPRSHINALFGLQNLKDALPVPFVFRVLTPWTVWALPFSTSTGFHLVNVLGVAGAAAILYLYARSFFDRSAALRAVAFFVLGGNVLGLLMDPWLVDGLAFFLSILSFLLVRHGRLGWAAVTLSVGVAAHEILLIALATLVVAYLVENHWRFEPRLLLLIGLPLLVFALIHYTSLLYGSTLTYPFWSAEGRDAVLMTRRHLDGDLVKSVIFAFATSFGGIWILAVLGFVGSPRFLRATALMLPAVGLTFLFVSDWDRYLTFAFPVVIVLASRVPLRWPVLITFLVVQAWLSGLAINRNAGYYIDELSRRHTLLTLALLVVAFAIVVVGAVTMKRPLSASAPRRSAATNASSALR
jgi:hypothetical protein